MSYFVGLYVNPQSRAKGPLRVLDTRPILLRKVAIGLTLEGAEEISTARNLAAGHRCDDVELRLCSPEARFYMYDEEGR